MLGGCDDCDHFRFLGYYRERKNPRRADRQAIWDRVCAAHNHRKEKLIESEGKKLGLDLKTEWLRFTGGPPMNEALVSGNLDFASGGSGPLITAWARTKDNIKIKGICALNSMPLWLNTIKPEIKTIEDFTDKDRIALPTVRVSLQAVILQMAAEKSIRQRPRA